MKSDSRKKDVSRLAQFRFCEQASPCRNLCNNDQVYDHYKTTYKIPLNQVIFSTSSLLANDPFQRLAWWLTNSVVLTCVRYLIKVIYAYML